MKIRSIPLSLLGFSALSCPLLGQSNNVHGDPYTPVGTLTVTPTVVQPGVQPLMDWGIEYPKVVPEIIEKTPEGKITTKECVDLKIRVAGVAFQSGSTNLYTGLWVRVGGSSSAWEMVFYGRENEVEPDVYVFEEKNIQPGVEIDLGGRGRSSNGSWYSMRWTADSGSTVVGLVNGDPVPDYAPAYDQGRIESFMTQYLDENNNVVLGPRDIIYTFELASTNPGDWWYDMQDLVVIVTVEPCKNNNGHGNNEDGVDVSNPGQGGGGPNGEEDPSGNIDDEGNSGDSETIDTRRKIRRGRRRR